MYQKRYYFAPEFEFYGGRYPMNKLIAVQFSAKNFISLSGKRIDKIIQKIFAYIQVIRLVLEKIGQNKSYQSI